MLRKVPGYALWRRVQELVARLSASATFFVLISCGESDTTPVWPKEAVGPAASTSVGGGGASGSARPPTGGSGGNGTQAPQAGGSSTASAEAPILCDFAFGAVWHGLGESLPGMDTYSSWAGWEWPSDDLMQQDEFLRALSDDPQFRGALPVYITYFIPFMARAEWDLQDCNVRTCDETLADCRTLCTYGAAFIRANRTAIVNFYREYARQTVRLWGTERPFVWQLESDSYQYATNPHQFSGPPGTPANQQGGGLGFDGLGDLMRDIIAAIKGEMPNALCSAHVAAWNPDQSGYFEALPLEMIDLLHFSGEAIGEHLDRGAEWNDEATWTRVFEMSGGKPMLIDGNEGREASWLSAHLDDYNVRIAQGVIGVTLERPNETWAALSSRLAPQLPSVCGMAP